MLILGYAALGVFTGLFSNMFGVGGGIIMVPAMVLLFGMSQKGAQGASLAIMIPMALTGAIRYFGNPAMTFNLKMALIVAAFGVVGAFAGSWIASVASALVLRRMFACVMIVAAVQMLLKK
jgi:uncharacterized protein